MNDLIPASTRDLAPFVAPQLKSKPTKPARKKPATSSKSPTASKPRKPRKRVETVTAATMAAMIQTQTEKPESVSRFKPLLSEIALVMLVLIAVTFYGASQTSTEIPTVGPIEPSFHELVRDGLKNALNLN